MKGKIRTHRPGARRLFKASALALAMAHALPSIAADTVVYEASNETELRNALTAASGNAWTTIQVTNSFTVSSALPPFVYQHAVFLETLAGTTLTLNGAVSGTGSLLKTGDGNLVLQGANTYYFGNTFKGGSVTIGSDANLGAPEGNVIFDSGANTTLHTTADIVTKRSMALNGDATFLTDAGTTLTVGNQVWGSGRFIKDGAGTFVLSGANSFAKDIFIKAGTLQLGDGGQYGNISGNVVNNGALVFNLLGFLTPGTEAFSGPISGTGSVTQAGTGTIVLIGANTYTGGTTIASGTLQIGDGRTYGSIVGNVANQGALVFNRADDIAFDGVISGRGSVSQNGPGKLTLSGAHTYTGPTSVNAGGLIVNGSLASPVTVAAGTMLGGNGRIAGNVTNAGTIAPGNSIGTLTIAGNYIGQGGTLAIEAALDGDASPADRLVVAGDTSGATHVKVTNVGGHGAQTVDGIKVVEVHGASNGSFDLIGDYVYQGQQAVVSGAYAYRLYKNGVAAPNDGNWYLRSALVPSGIGDTYAPGVPLYEAYAGVLQTFNELDTLRQREGQPTWAMTGSQTGASDGDGHGGAVWVSVDSGHTELTPEISTTGTHYDATTQKLRAGVNAMLRESEAGVLVSGISARYGKVSSDVSSTFGTGRITTTGYGVGGSLTWYGKSGFYLDTQAQWNRYDTDIRSRTLGKMLADGNKGSGYALGVEAGQKFALSDRWSLTPQAQLSYSSVRFDSFTDPYGGAVRGEDGDSLMARAGLALDHEDAWQGSDGKTRRLRAYGIANVYYGFLDGTKVGVLDLRANSKLQPLWGGLGMGGTFSWADDKYALYGEANARTSLKDFGDSKSFGLKIAFRMAW